MANKLDLQALLAQLAELNADDLKSVTSQASALKRDKKAREDKAALKDMFAPLFDAIDKTVASNPKLAAHIADKDALRVYFSEEQKCDRETYHSYGKRDFGGSSGSRNGYAVWYPSDGGHIEYPSMRALCNALGIPDNGANARVDLKKHKVVYLTEKPSGEILTA